MAVVDAAPRSLRGEIRSGVRPFDIGRDLRPVAELIADAFTHELDPRGLAALREMRIMSHLSGLLKLLSRTTSDLDDVFGGFVWLEDGRIVGNVTVQRADKYGNRWQIANVAVSPAYRGRGIARRLMDHALDHVARCGGRWAVLQVYAHNQVARTLYSHLGFEEVGGMVDLQLARLPRVEMPSQPAGFSSFASYQWLPLYELATNQLNSQAQWWRSIRRSDFQTPFEQQLMEWVWHFAGRRHVYRRCIRSLRRFEAALILKADRWGGPHELEMWVRPEQYGTCESFLLQWTLATLRDYPQRPLKLTVSREHGAALQSALELGFMAEQTLVTMRRSMDDFIDDNLD
jgi:ribosomal protein S18 acetylase RimI-like enzyme